MLYDDAKEFQFRPQEQNNLLSTILLVASVTLSLILCFGWCAVLTYRECKYARLKRKRKKEMMKSVQQLLELSPTVLFDASEKNSDSVDEDPSCAICLEPFADQDRLRKLGRSICPCLLSTRRVVRSKSARILSIWPASTRGWCPVRVVHCAIGTFSKIRSRRFHAWSCSSSIEAIRLLPIRPVTCPA